MHEREYVVVTDSTLQDIGCFADSLAGAVGARAGWISHSMPSFTLSHLSDAGVVRVRRTPHVVDVHKTVNFPITDLPSLLPRSVPPR